MELLELMERTLKQIKKLYSMNPNVVIYICIVARTTYILYSGPNGTPALSLSDYVISLNDFMDLYPRFKEWIMEQGQVYNPDYNDCNMFDTYEWIYPNGDRVDVKEKIKQLEKFIEELRKER